MLCKVQGASRGFQCSRESNCFDLLLPTIGNPGYFSFIAIAIAMSAAWVLLLESMSPATTTLQIFILLVVIACSTRFISGINYVSSLSRNGTNGSGRKVATLPYWFPYFGHSLPLTINPDRFLQKCWCVLRIPLHPRMTSNPSAANDHLPESSH